MFKGAITALITPFNNDKIDEDAFVKLINRQIDSGIHGLVPSGTTGESPTLSHEEHKRVFEICSQVAKGKVPVIAGAGSNSTSEAVMLSQNAQKAGCDAVLIATPYYNKPTDAGLYQHFKVIAESIDIPLVIYNIPGRSAVDLQDATIAKLAEIKNIVGLKDATGDLARVSNLRKYLADKENFAQISGEDATALSFNAQGGVGCISVTSNIAPSLVADVQNLWFGGKFKEALEVHEKLIPLHDAMFCETSPAPAKYAASLLGLCSDEIRLPLVLPSDASKQKIKTALKNLDLI